MNTKYVALLVVSICLVVRPILAQDDALIDEDPDLEASGETDEDEAFLAGIETAEIEAPAVEKDTGRAEEPGKAYFSVGARLRWIMIPEWLIKWFGVDTTRPSDDPGSALPLISNIGVGPEFTYRRDGFDITAAVWFVGLGWDDPISFKESDKGESSWEYVTNDMKAMLITADFMWSTALTDWVAIMYGAGLGLGIPWGDIIRTEATAESDGTEPCDGPDPDEDPWCGEGEEYNETYDKLKVVPWVNFLVGARFKPHRHVAVVVDGGFGMGFQVGLRAGYIF
ncbi:MAG: hypothetical protein QNJ97_07705 [Myxococcota bacterium]|nr:hypothetical protein [Myxococcota bacterium]